VTADTGAVGPIYLHQWDDSTFLADSCVSHTNVQPAQLMSTTAVFRRQSWWNRCPLTRMSFHCFQEIGLFTVSRNERSLPRTVLLFWSYLSPSQWNSSQRDQSRHPRSPPKPNSTGFLVAPSVALSLCAFNFIFRAANFVLQSFHRSYVRIVYKKTLPVKSLVSLPDST
jgi:hypothetical protein